MKKRKAADSKKQTPDNPEVQAGSEAAKEAGPGFPIVGIGASAGGLAAFEAFFSGMPADKNPGVRAGAQGGGSPHAEGQALHHAHPALPLDGQCHRGALISLSKS